MSLTAFLSCRRLPSTAIMLLASHSVFAGVMAVGSVGHETDWSTFVTKQGTGLICVALQIGTASNDPGVGAANRCSTDVFLMPRLFGTAVAQQKLPDMTTISSHSDSLSAAGVTAKGNGRWSYISRVVLPDSADYVADTSITPAPLPAFAPAARARVKSSDPVEFDAPIGGMLGFKATLFDLLLEAPPLTLGGSAGFDAEQQLDGNLLYGFHIAAPSNFASINDLEIQYVSVLGSVFDNAMTTTILSSLTLDIDQGRIGLSGPIELFPRTEFSYTVGKHELRGGIGTAVDAIPEPSSLSLIALGIFCFFLRWRGN